MWWHAKSALYFYIVCCILLLGFSIWLDAKLNGGMRLYLCILPPPAIITSGAHLLLYPSTYNTTYYTYQHATPAVERRYQEDFTYTYKYSKYKSISTTLYKLNMHQSGLKKMPAGAVRPSGIFVKQRQMVAQPPREERLGMLLLINSQQPQQLTTTATTTNNQRQQPH